MYSFNAYIKKKKKSQINNLTFYHKTLEKKDQTKPEMNRRKEIGKIRVEINEMGNRKTIEKIM